MGLAKKFDQKGIQRMAKYTKQDIIAMVEEEDVEFIRMQFTDIEGNFKNVAITSKGAGQRLYV